MGLARVHSLAKKVAEAQGATEGPLQPRGRNILSTCSYTQKIRINWLDYVKYIIHE